MNGDANPGQWADLNTRIASAVVMVAIGGAAIWAGGGWFLLLAAIVAGGMAWELARMTVDQNALPGPSLAIGVLAAVVILVAGGLTHPFWQVTLAAPALALALTERRDRVLTALYALGLMVAVWGLVGLRAGGGITAVLWLVLVVVASDVMGYFAGRRFGGPKFWPAISPKKTWSGTVAGWIGAAVIGAVFWLAGFGGIGLIVVSVLVAFAGQMGDICESWIKRRAGVKDASNLIPGHGGLMDRFDALTAAALVLVILSAFGLLPVRVW